MVDGDDDDGHHDISYCSKNRDRIVVRPCDIDRHAHGLDNGHVGGVGYGDGMDSELAAMMSLLSDYD